MVAAAAGRQTGATAGLAATGRQANVPLDPPSAHPETFVTSYVTNSPQGPQTPARGTLSTPKPRLASQPVASTLHQNSIPSAVETNSRED
jgi:hypothetical protein